MFGSNVYETMTSSARQGRKEGIDDVMSALSALRYDKPHLTLAQAYKELCKQFPDEEEEEEE